MSQKWTEQLEKILGRKGRLVSMSKSCGPAMAVYNSNVVIDEEVVWYGDVDVDDIKGQLLVFTEIYGKVVDIYYESALRVWDFEKDTPEKAKEKRDQQISTIQKKQGLVWSSGKPDEYCGEPYDEIRVRNEEIREKRIKERMIYAGILTPLGTQWRWYNIWFYKTIYKSYQLTIQRWWNIFKYAKYYFKKDGLLVFLKAYVKEIGYYYDIKSLQEIELSHSK